MLDVSTTAEGRLALRGELDLLSFPALEAVLARAEIQGNEIDLGDVTFFDSSVLRAFLAAPRRNASLRIVNPSKAVMRVLEITGTIDYLVHGRELGW